MTVDSVRAVGTNNVTIDIRLGVCAIAAVPISDTIGNRMSIGVNKYAIIDATVRIVKHFLLSRKSVPSSS